MLAYYILRMAGRRNDEIEWKNRNTGSRARRQSTNDIISSIKEKQRRPSEEALFSSGKNFFIVLIF